MNVEEVTELHNVLRTITKHFESSIKNKELLNECLSILEVQPIHLISWCQTRMGYFFKACTACNDILPAVYDVMATANICVEERDIFFTAKNIYTLNLVSDVEPFFSRDLCVHLTSQIYWYLQFTIALLRYLKRSVMIL